MTVRTCRQCRETRDLALFYGRSHLCSSCCWLNASERSRRSHASPAGKAATRRYHLKRYARGPEIYELMRLLQLGACAICGKPETRGYEGAPKLLSVDHDHRTGKIRGLLCAACNEDLVGIERGAEWAGRAPAYLTRWRA